VPERKKREIPEAARRALDEFLFHLGLVRGASVRTVAAYRSDLENFFEDLAARGIDGPARVDEKILREHIIRLHEKGRQASTVARARSALRTFFAFLLDEGVVAEDPAATLRAPAGWRRIPRSLSVAEARALVEAPRAGGPLDLRDRAMLECAYGTGARVSELLALRPADCRWEDRLLRFTGKGSRVRLVPLGRPALAALRTYLERARPALAARNRRGAPEEIFLNARGGRLSRMGFWKIVRQRAAQAGLKGRIHPHLLRHTYATHLLHGGASLRVVQELLGHSRLATTQVYTHVDAAYLQRAHRQYHPRG
jgi:site-specific recombinase XerD